MIFPRSTFSWSTTCQCTLALSRDTGSDLGQPALAVESLQGKATPVTSPHPFPAPASLGLTIHKGSCSDSCVPALHPSLELLSTSAVKHFSLCRNRAWCCISKGSLPVLGIWIILILTKPVQAAVGSESETLWSAGMQPFPGDFPENPAFLPARAAAARSSESWGKGREVWYLGEDLWEGDNRRQLPQPSACGGHEAGCPLFSSIPVTC